MADIPIYEGSSLFEPGLTPFGFYDNDVDFQKDADLVVKYCSRRLGYPIVAIELQDINFYAAFEEAITAYGNELYSYQIRDNQLSYLELPIPESGSFNNNITYPNLKYVIKLSTNYGSEVGVGGDMPLYSGSIELTPGIQTYDLKQWASDNNVEAGELEVRRVFYEAPPAIMRYFDPFAGSGTGYQGMMDSFGFGQMSPAVSFLMMPLSYDVQTLQAIELNDQIRRSNYSFQLTNNEIKIFPIPQKPGRMWFEYIKSSERGSKSNLSLVRNYKTGVYENPKYPKGWISNVANAPYKNPTYSEINSVGRSWIFEYSLAVCKEILGFIRGKYSSIPIPNDQTSLNSNDLTSQGQKEKEDLKIKLRDYFDQTSRQKLLERRSAETEYMNKELNNIPFSMIYVG